MFPLGDRIVACIDAKNFAANVLPYGVFFSSLDLTMPHVRAGYDVPFEPFGIVREGRPSGMLIELVDLLLTRAGVSHEFLHMPLADTEPSLFEGRIEALAFKAMTPERLPLMDFSAPLIVSGAAAFPRSGLAPSTDLNDYAGLTAVTTRQGPFWKHVERNFPDIRLEPAENYERALDRIVAGTADIAVLNLHAGIATAERVHPGKLELPNAPYAPLAVGFATAKGRHAELIARVNEQLGAARADGSWQRIRDSWLTT